MSNQHPCDFKLARTQNDLPARVLNGQTAARQLEAVRVMPLSTAPGRRPTAERQDSRSNFLPPPSAKQEIVNIKDGKSRHPKYGVQVD
ncbi:hypothetical protein GmRootV35_13850 [Variovorax sp. V35]